MIRKMALNELDFELLKEFKNGQMITSKWTKQADQWVLVACDERRAWTLDKKRWLVTYLNEFIAKNGVLLGAFDKQQLIGFACIDGNVINGYANLAMLFVDNDYQRCGIGKALFQKIIQLAKDKGASKLFISAIPSYETIAFYMNMGCQDAKMVIDSFVDTKEDRYMEYVLK